MKTLQNRGLMSYVTLGFVGFMPMTALGQSRQIIRPTTVTTAVTSITGAGGTGCTLGSTDNQTGYPRNPWRSDGKWDCIITNRTLNNPLVVDKNHVLLYNVTITNFKTAREQILQIKDSQYVMIVLLKIEKTESTSSNGDAVQFVRTKDVIINQSEIRDFYSTGQSNGIEVYQECERIKIDDNLIEYVSGNGIETWGCSPSAADGAPCPDYNQNPVPGLKIINNTIHDTGYVADNSTDGGPKSPKHGMYIKAVNPLIEGNVVYNAYDGDCISIRSSAQVRRNSCWNGRNGVISYYPQKPATGSDSDALIIENNLVFQTTQLRGGDSRVLYCNNPVLEDPGPSSLNPNSTNKIPVKNFVVRFNTVYVGTNSGSTRPALFVGARGPGNPLKRYVFGNLVVDERTGNYPYGTGITFPFYIAEYFTTKSTNFTYDSGNKTSQVSSIFITPTAATRNFRLKSRIAITLTSAPAGLYDFVGSRLPPNDLDNDPSISPYTVGAYTYQSSFPNGREAAKDETLPEETASLLKLRTFPNPVINGDLKAEFTIDETTSARQVQLSLYDAHGQETKRLFEGQNVRYKSMNVNLDRLSPGLYLLVLTVDGRKNVQKILIVQ